MKKVGLWMAALTAVTVGGVYASFYYSQTIAGITENKARAIQVAGTLPTGFAAGTYAIDTTTLLAQIDSAEQFKKDGVNLEYVDANYATLDNHTALLHMTGKITITFTPDASAEQTVQDCGIKTNVDLSATDTGWTYTYTDPVSGVSETVDILNAVDQTGCDFVIYPYGSTGGVKTWTRTGTEGNYVFVYEIDAEDIYNETTKLISLNSVVLETIVEHTAYDTAIDGKEIKVTVTSVA